jgi:hypothetical protein
MIVPNSPAAFVESQGWKIHSVSGNIAHVHVRLNHGPRRLRIFIRLVRSVPVIRGVRHNSVTERFLSIQRGLDLKF